MKTNWHLQKIKAQVEKEIAIRIQREKAKQQQQKKPSLSFLYSCLYE